MKIKTISNACLGSFLYILSALMSCWANAVQHQVIEVLPEQIPQVMVKTGRARHAMAIDPVANKVILFGGYITPNYNAATNDTLIMDLNLNTVQPVSSPNTNPRMQWKTLIPVGSPGPYCRNDHTLIFEPQTAKIYLFGGRNGSASVGHDSLLWSMDLRATPHAWTQVQVAGGAVPTPRFEHMSSSFVRNGVSYLVVYGGFVASSTVSNELWVFNLQTLTWTQVLGHNLPALRGGGLVWDSSRSVFVMAGGFSSNNTPNAQTYEWNGDFSNPAWTSTCSSPALAKTGINLVYDSVSNNVVAFGGDPSGSGVVNQVIDLRTNIPTPGWFDRETYGGTNPFKFFSVNNPTMTTLPARRYSAAVFIPGRNSILVTGGEDGNGNLTHKDTFEIHSQPSSYVDPNLAISVGTCPLDTYQPVSTIPLKISFLSLPVLGQVSVMKIETGNLAGTLYGAGHYGFHYPQNTPVATPYLNCPWYVNLNMGYLNTPSFVNPGPYSVIEIPFFVPNNPAVVGMNFIFQNWIFDTQAQASNSQGAVVPSLRTSNVIPLQLGY